MKTEKVLKIFREAVLKKEYRFITSEKIIEKDGYLFTIYDCYSDGSCFVGAEKQSEPFIKLLDLGNITTLKELRTRLGL